MYADMGSDLAWTNAEHLAAATFDATQIQTWNVRGSKGAPPEPIPRPAQMAAEAGKKDRIAARAQRFQARRSRRVDERGQ